MVAAETTAEVTFSSAALFGYWLKGTYCLFLPVVMFIILRRRTRASAIPLAVGFLSYMALSWVRAVFRMLITNGMRDTPWAFYLWTAIISGVIEEVARYVVFRYILHNHDEWKDAVSYGIGHGGCECILASAFLSFQYLSTGLECNRLGTAHMIKASTAEESAKLLHKLEVMAEMDTLYETVGMLIGFTVGMAFHIAMSMLVFAAVHYIGEKKQLYIAIALHTFADIAPYLLLTPVFAVLCILPSPESVFPILMCIYVWRVYKRLSCSPTKEDDHI